MLLAKEIEVNRKAVATAVRASSCQALSLDLTLGFWLSILRLLSPDPPFPGVRMQARRINLLPDLCEIDLDFLRLPRRGLPKLKGRLVCGHSQTRRILAFVKMYTVYPSMPLRICALENFPASLKTLFFVHSPMGTLYCFSCTLMNPAASMRDLKLSMISMSLSDFAQSLLNIGPHSAMRESGAIVPSSDNKLYTR